MNKQKNLYKIINSSGVALLATTVRQTSSLIAEGEAAAKFVLTQPSGQHSTARVTFTVGGRVGARSRARIEQGVREERERVAGKSVNIATTISISISIRAARLRLLAWGLPPFRVKPFTAPAPYALSPSLSLSVCLFA